MHIKAILIRADTINSLGSASMLTIVVDVCFCFIYMMNAVAVVFSFSLRTHSHTQSQMNQRPQFSLKYLFTISPTALSVVCV